MASGVEHDVESYTLDHHTAGRVIKQLALPAPQVEGAVQRPVTAAAAPGGPPTVAGQLQGRLDISAPSHVSSTGACLIAAKPVSHFFISSASGEEYDADDVLQDRQHGGVVELMHAGAAPRVLWPHLEHQVDPTKVVDFEVTFSLVRDHLSELLRNQGSSSAPVVLSTHTRTLQRHFRHHGHMTSSPGGYDFVPYTIQVVRTSSYGVPVALLGQFVSKKADTTPKEWLRMKGMQFNDDGKSGKTYAFRVEPNTVFAPGVKAPPLFVNNEEIVNSAQFARWAPIHQNKLRRQLNQAMDKNGVWYQFTLDNNHVHTAPSAGCYAAVRNLPYLYDNAPEEQKRDPQDVVQILESKRVSVAVPVASMDNLLQDSYNALDLDNTCINFTDSALVLTPEVDWADAQAYINNRAGATAKFKSDPAVRVTVTLRFVGTFIPCPPEYRQ